MKFLSAVFIVISWVIALYNPSWIVALMSLSWGAIAGTFLAPILRALLARDDKDGCLCRDADRIPDDEWDLLVSLFCDISECRERFAPVAASIAIVAPFVTVPIVSLITRPCRLKLSRRHSPPVGHGGISGIS